MQGLGHADQTDWSRILSALAFATCAVCLLGWALDIAELKAGLAGLRATQPLSAVLVGCCALGVWLSPKGAAAEPSLACRTLALVVLLATAFVILENAFDADWGSDRLLFPNAVVTEQTGPYLRAGRPAGAMLIANILAAVALLTSQSLRPGLQRVFVAASTTGLLGCLSVVFAYAFSVPSLQAMGLYALVGLVGATAMSLVFAALLVSRPQFGWVAQLRGDSIGAVTSRHLLLWTAAVLFVSAVIVRVGTLAQWYRAEVAVAMVALSGFAVLFAALLAYARRMDALGLSLARTEQGLEDSRHREERTAQALQSFERRKQAFLEDLEHELRNPLAPMTTSVALLRLRLERDIVTDQALFLMERQTRKLAQAIDKAVADYQRSIPQPGDLGWRNDP